MAKGDWWFKFEWGKWRNDSALRRCSLAAKGFWIECLCAMREAGTDRIEGTFEEVARLVGCFPEEVSRCAVELQRTGTADVMLGNGCVMLVSRYITKELNTKELNRLRVAKHRGNGDVMPDVTVQSKSKSKSKEKNKKSADAADTAKEEAVGKSKPTDERKNHPAIVAILQHTTARPPKSVYDALISTIGDKPDVDRLKQCFTDWCLKGWNPQNFAWVTEWYANSPADEVPASNGRLPYDLWVECAFARSTPEEKREKYPLVRAEYLFQWPNTESEVTAYEQTAEYRENYAGTGSASDGFIAPTGRGGTQTQSKVPVSH